MAIVDRSKMSGRIEIDLAGPEGNAFVLMGYARKLAKGLSIDEAPIIEEMTAGDYDNLINVFDSYFGDYVTLYK